MNNNFLLSQSNLFILFIYYLLFIIIYLFVYYSFQQNSVFVFSKKLFLRGYQIRVTQARPWHNRFF